MRTWKPWSIYSASTCLATRSGASQKQYAACLTLHRWCCCLYSRGVVQAGHCWTAQLVCPPYGTQQGTAPWCTLMRPHDTHQSMPRHAPRRFPSLETCCTSRPCTICPPLACTATPWPSCHNPRYIIARGADNADNSDTANAALHHRALRPFVQAFVIASLPALQLLDGHAITDTARRDAQRYTPYICCHHLLPSSC